MGFLEVIRVLVEIFVSLVVEQATNVSSDYTKSNSYSQWDECSCNLESSLPRHSSPIRYIEVWTRIFGCDFRVVADVIPEKDDSAPDAPQESRNTMKIMNSTCIV